MKHLYDYYTPLDQLDTMRLQALPFEQPQIKAIQMQAGAGRPCPYCGWLDCICGKVTVEHPELAYGFMDMLAELCDMSIEQFDQLARARQVEHRA